MDSRYFLASIVESSQDSIITVDFELTITTWNKAAESLYGYTAEEAIGESLTSLTLPGDLEQLLQKVDDVRHNRVLGMFETERVGKGDRHMVLEVVVSPVLNDEGSVIGISTIARDVTERKANAEAEMLRRLLLAQEDERARIARDIHDELGQQMTVLRYQLNAAKEQCSEEETCSRIHEIARLAEEMDKSVDFLAWELRPAFLEGSGLVAALGYYMKQWSNHSGVPVEPALSRLQGTRLGEDVEVALYRIAQEALNNIHKHAQAKGVVVALEKRADSVLMIIADDGKGFSPAKNGNRSSQGLGLIGMRERAALIGGTLKVDSSPGSGTTVSVMVPVNKGRKSAQAARRAKTNDSGTKPVKQRRAGH